MPNRFSSRLWHSKSVGSFSGVLPTPSTPSTPSLQTPASKPVAAPTSELETTDMNSPGLVAFILGIMAGVCGLLCWLGSPYWQSARQVDEMPLMSQAVLQQQLPASLKGHLLSVSTHDPIKEWKGPGKTYLQNQWKTIQHHQTSAFELQQALLIQRGQAFKRGYLAFPNRFYWTQGTDRHQVRLEFTRVGFWHWELSNACYPFAQPWPDARICPSDTR